MFTQEMEDIYKNLIKPMIEMGYKVIIDKEKETITFVKQS